MAFTQTVIYPKTLHFWRRGFWANRYREEKKNNDKDKNAGFGRRKREAVA